MKTLSRYKLLPILMIASFLVQSTAAQAGLFNFLRSPSKEEQSIYRTQFIKAQKRFASEESCRDQEKLAQNIRLSEKRRQEEIRGTTEGVVIGGLAGLMFLGPLGALGGVLAGALGLLDGISGRDALDRETSAEDLASLLCKQNGQEEYVNLTKRDPDLAALVSYMSDDWQLDELSVSVAVVTTPTDPKQSDPKPAAQPVDEGSAAAPSSDATPAS